ncbi:amidohydrolase [Sphaerisporangium album]|uniref:Amidohydrolase n=1 Tax=Sphaerisporangium album TaxID=509200 RepID=A0A367FFF0_9ACTN|nr:amidohydrolase family protein [Sphaerisporangium album]RCG28407.1 amidohydrolase [Sphaerisporangium album]
MPEPGDLADLRLRDYRPYSRMRAPNRRRARAAVSAMDAHAHLGRWLTGGDWAVPDVAELIDLMEACNIAAMVNLDGRWGGELEANLDRYDRAHPDRFATFCHVDWNALAEPRPGERLAGDLARSVASGARGLKVWKDLGLEVRDGDGRLVSPDDRRLAPLWEKAAELGVPVAIHTADPVAFFDPVDERNERLEELLRHPEWSFADERYPRFERLIAALEALVAANPDTAFIGLHAGCHAEDLSWVDRMLGAYPNLCIDIAARVAELGRQPRRTRELIMRHRDRVLFGTDQIPPRREVYEIYFRFAETADEHFPYSPKDPPPNGRWRISGIDLPTEVLEKVYAGNLRRLLGGRG